MESLGFALIILVIFSLVLVVKFEGWINEKRQDTPATKPAASDPPAQPVQLVQGDAMRSRQQEQELLRLRAQVAEQKARADELHAQLAQKASEIESLNDKITEKSGIIASATELLALRECDIQSLKEQIAAKDKEIQSLNSQILKLHSEMATKQKRIVELEEEFHVLAETYSRESQKVGEAPQENRAICVNSEESFISLLTKAKIAYMTGFPKITGRETPTELLAKCNGRSDAEIAIMCGMPWGDEIGEDGLPHTFGNRGEGDIYTVYIAPKGTVYHCYSDCSQAAMEPVNYAQMYLRSGYRHQCSRCQERCRSNNVRFIERSGVEWFFKYKSVKNEMRWLEMRSSSRLPSSRAPTKK